MRPRPRETKLALKKHRILNEVFRSGTCSRFELARRLNINATMVSDYVEALLAKGLLVEDEPTSSGRGRSPVPLRLNPQYGNFLGIDFEALRARAVLTDFSGTELRRNEISFPPNLSRDDVLQSIISLAQDLAAQSEAPLLSIGVAAPGQVDTLEGKIIHYDLLPDFDEIPLQSLFESHFEETPILVEDNIRALTYAELLRGSGSDCRNFLCLSIRSGVGLGIVIDGKLYSGVNSMSGEVGYLVSPESISNDRRTLTDIVSATGFVTETRRALDSLQQNVTRRQLLEKGDALSLADIVSVAEAGDEFLRKRLEELGTSIGVTAANLANLFAPEKILLAGEVPSCSMLVRNQIERNLRKFTLPQIASNVYLEEGALRAFAGAFGAAWMGVSRRFPEDEEILINLLSEQSESTSALRAS